MELTYAEFSRELKMAAGGLNSTFVTKTTLKKKLKKLAEKLKGNLGTYKKETISRGDLKRHSTKSDRRFYKPFDPQQQYQVIYMCWQEQK